jgi:DNA invertase Pin-like site-specific DNA recombinase
MNNPKKQVIGYARVSSETQRDNTSIAEQKERIKAFSISQGWELTKIFVDEAKSGKTDDRPGYKEMMKYINENKTNAILVYKTDRLGRKLKNTLILIEDVLKPKDISLISVTEPFDTSTEVGMAFIKMLGTFAELERDFIVSRTTNGRLSKAKKGDYAGGQVAYGYEVVEGKVRIIPEQATIVKRIFEEFINGRSYAKIARDLNSEQIPTKSGKQWQIQTIIQTLQTETYTGKNSYNNIKQKNIFPKIISTQTWNKAQEDPRMKRRTVKSS